MEGGYQGGGAIREGGREERGVLCRGAGGWVDRVPGGSRGGGGTVGAYRLVLLSY